MNKKITFIINGLRGGGAEGVCVNVANCLAEKGMNITIVILSIKNGIWANDLSDKVHLINLNKKHARFAVVSIWRYLAYYKPDVVLSFNHQLSVVIGIIRYLSRMKFKLVSRNINILSQIEKNGKRLGFWYGTFTNILIKMFYPLSDQFIALCWFAKKDLETYLKINASRIIVIYNPINKKIENYLKTASQSENVKKDYLLCVGRLEPQKAFDYAIEAFSRIVVDYPQLRLKILGQGSLDVQLKQLAFNLGVADKIDFEGFQEDTISYYVHARLLIMTSLYESFGNVLGESIALGTPIVSFDSPGSPSEIIQEGVNGYLARYQDIDHLTECLRRALDRQWNTETVMATADRFSSEKIIDEYEKVLA